MQELPNLQRVNRELADRGPEMVARHLARHRTRIEREGAGWFGRSRPPSRSEVELLFAQIDLGSGGTSALAALIGTMQRRQEANAAMHQEMGHKDEGDGVSLLMTKFQAGSICKSWYDGIRDLDPADHIGNDLNIKLLSVLQSVDTRPYYRRMVDDGTGKMKVHYETETE